MPRSHWKKASYKSILFWFPSSPVMLAAFPCLNLCCLGLTVVSNPSGVIYGHFLFYAQDWKEKCYNKVYLTGWKNNQESGIRLWKTSFLIMPFLLKIKECVYSSPELLILTGLAVGHELLSLFYLIP